MRPPTTHKPSCTRPAPVFVTAPARGQPAAAPVLAWRQHDFWGHLAVFSTPGTGFPTPQNQREVGDYQYSATDPKGKGLCGEFLGAMGVAFSFATTKCMLCFLRTFHETCGMRHMRLCGSHSCALGPPVLTVGFLDLHTAWFARNCSFVFLWASKLSFDNSCSTGKKPNQHEAKTRIRHMTQVAAKFSKSQPRVDLLHRPGFLIILPQKFGTKGERSAVEDH